MCSKKVKQRTDMWPHLSDGQQSGRVSKTPRRQGKAPGYQYLCLHACTHTCTQLFLQRALPEELEDTAPTTTSSELFTERMKGHPSCSLAEHQPLFISQSTMIHSFTNGLNSMSERQRGRKPVIPAEGRLGSLEALEVSLTGHIISPLVSEVPLLASQQDNLSLCFLLRERKK